MFTSGKVLYSNSDMTYVKVPVRKGKRLNKNAVPQTCEIVGLRAVCPGPTSCANNSDKCLVTPLSTNCDSPMAPLSQQLCNKTNPVKCNPLEGVFSYMANFDGECGNVKGRHCAPGRKFVSGSPDEYFAYCVDVWLS